MKKVMASYKIALYIIDQTSGYFGRKPSFCYDIHIMDDRHQRPKLSHGLSHKTQVKTNAFPWHCPLEANFLGA